MSLYASMLKEHTGTDTYTNGIQQNREPRNRPPTYIDKGAVSSTNGARETGYALVKESLHFI